MPILAEVPHCVLGTSLCVACPKHCTGLEHEIYFPGTDYHILSDGEDFQGILLSNESMRSNMDAFPEFLGIDVTYKLLEIHTPVYVMHVEDSNGDTEMVCVAVLVRECVESLKWMFD